MGTVYRAEHMKLKKQVAIKLLPAHETHDPLAVARFHREMEAVGKLDHPNIVRATDAGEIGDSYYLVMELVRGEDLRKLVRRLGRVPIAAACELVRQVALGLQHAYEHGLVHRDIKPSNLILTPEGRVKILDLGLARLHGENRPGEELTATGAVMGTADYMAPEQGTDTHSVDIRADLYSLGCTLYHLLAGRPPFHGPNYDTLLKKMHAHAETPVPRIREFVADIPPVLEEIVGRLLSKRPSDRYATPGELARVLKPLAAGCDLSTLTWGSPKDAGDLGVGAPSTDDDRAAVTRRTDAAMIRAEPGPTATMRARPIRSRTIIAMAAVAAVITLAAVVKNWRPDRPLDSGRRNLPPDPVMVMALELLPGLNGQWWFDETPWLAPAVRSQLLSAATAAERQGLSLLGGSSSTADRKDGANSTPENPTRDPVQNLYSRLAELTQRYLGSRPYTEVDHLQSLLVLADLSPEDLPSELSKLAGRLQAKVDATAADLHLLAVINHKLGQWDAARQDYNRAITAYETSAQRAAGLYALCLADFGRMQFDAADPVAAVGLYRRAREAAGASNSPFFLVDVGCNESNAQRRLGNWKDAETCLAAALSIAQEKIGKDHPLAAHVHERFAWFYLDSWSAGKAIERFGQARQQREASARLGNPLASVFAFHDRHGECMARRFSGDGDAARNGYDQLIADIERALEAGGISAKERRDLGQRVVNSRERRGDCDLFAGAPLSAVEKYESAFHFGDQEDLFVGRQLVEAVRLRYKLAIAWSMGRRPTEARQPFEDAEQRRIALTDGQQRDLQSLRDAANAILRLAQGDIARARQDLLGFVQQQYDSRRNNISRDDLDLLLLAMRALLSFLPSDAETGDLRRTVDLTVRLARLPLRWGASPDVLRYLRPTYTAAIEGILTAAEPDALTALRLSMEARTGKQQFQQPVDRPLLVFHLSTQRGWAMVATPGTTQVRHFPLTITTGDMAAQTAPNPMLSLPADLKAIIGSAKSASIVWTDPITQLAPKNYPFLEPAEKQFLEP
jgi:serine/threonine protein kinase/tetratricopeptide (TPR) repeat protein